MEGYRPLSMRGKPNSDFDTLHEGVPPWLREPLRAWFEPHMSDYNGGWDDNWLQLMQARMRSTFNWGAGVGSAGADVLGRLRGTNGLDFIDYVLRYQREWNGQNARRAEKDLAVILEAGGSAWEITRLPNSRDATLTRRALGPIREIIEDISTSSERAGAHLRESWIYLAGRDPVPDQAYFHAVLAVEAAAKPVVSPDDGAATLGKMIRAVQDKPAKWSFTLGDPLTVVASMKLLWQGHRRHGTDDREAPMGMSQVEADAGVHLALTLVRWFASEAFAVA